MWVDHVNTIWFLGSWIPFLDSLSFFWLIVCADAINKCGWCLARGRGCWLKGLQQDPKCKLIISSFLTFPYLIHWLICTRNIVLLRQMTEGMGGDPWVTSGCGWTDRWWISSDSFCFFFVLFFYSCIFFSQVLRPFMMVVMSVSMFFFVFCLWSLSTRSYWCIKIVMLVV